MTAKVRTLNPQEKREFSRQGRAKGRRAGLLRNHTGQRIHRARQSFQRALSVFKSKTLLRAARGNSQPLAHRGARRQPCRGRIQVDSSYGYQLINENLVHPYAVAARDRFYDGTYDPSGSWHSMYYLTTALIYNTTLVKPESVPQTYDALLDPAWKGKLLFDPEAGYILAAMEQAWGREKAVDYLTKLRKQDLSFRRGGALTTQVVSSGEYPIGIAINGETSAAIRDKGAPLGFKVLSPKIVKPEGLFLAKNSPHPHAAILFADGFFRKKGKRMLAGKLGKGVAMKGSAQQISGIPTAAGLRRNPQAWAQAQGLRRRVCQE